MNRMFFSVSTVFICLFACTTAQARKNTIDAGLGFGEVSRDGFERAGSVMTSYIYSANKVKVSSGQYLVNKIESERGNGELRVVGIYAAAGYEFDIGPLFLELQGGAAYSRTDARIFDQRVGRDENGSAIVLVTLGRQLSPLIGIKIGASYISDVSGDALAIMNAGIRWSF